LISLFITWDQVQPLFEAAARPLQLPSLEYLSQRRHFFDPNRNIENVDKRQLEREPLLVGRELKFQYTPQSRPVLVDCFININKGDRILLEGSSGSGKTTLAAILTGLRKPVSGTLILNGIDRHVMGTNEWRRSVVMAPQFQENHIFSETFAFNLLMGRRWPPNKEDLELADQICRDLGLDELLDKMPSGFQQMIGENGWQLSHGERSRMFIARTILQEASLLILDESFGALDPKNLKRALQTVLSRAPTLLVIAHP
jgi:ATP-binding cassette subfamily B protein